MKTFRKLTKRNREKVANEVKLMLIAHRDCLWTRYTECSHAQAVDPAVWRCVANEGYYGEAFGVVRALVALGYGYFGPDGTDAVKDGRSGVPEHNLKWWFNDLLKEINCLSLGVVFLPVKGSKDNNNGNTSWPDI